MTWRVFAQDDAPRLRVREWQHNARQFFETDLEIRDPHGAVAKIAIGPSVREIRGRLRDEDDLRDALEIENARGNGMYDLAERRCGSVWVVEREGPDDRAALVIAAVIASVCLGPILGDGALFGVRTAREKLDELVSPYR
ncbi:MAG TPA: hypothetical protein VGH87_15835 [Polyangiaceae bacterium]